MSLETLRNYQLAQKSMVELVKIKKFDDWSKFLIEYTNEQLACPVIIDALYGIGFKGSLSPLECAIVLALNDMLGLKVAVDMPSGVETNNGFVESVAFNADITVTMHKPKYGHYIGKGKEYSGLVVPIDIGIPSFLETNDDTVLLMDENSISYPERNQRYHKGMYGKIAIIAGSSGYTGAAILASKAALKSGSGLITLFHPQGLETIFESQLIEVMSTPFPFSSESFKIKEIVEWVDELRKYDALLIGPGLGISPVSEAIVDQITNTWDKPMVIDADALNILAKKPTWLKRLKEKQCVLTPHVGEFIRLASCKMEEYESDIIGCLKKFSAKVGCSVLFKDTTRIFLDQDQLLFDISGNDGLATGGSGDVLAGIIVSFLGQNLSVADASISASYLLGSTAEKVAEKKKTPSITPSDIIEHLFLVEEES
jgi:NAD(P)H-hydrate epimerase